MSGSRRLVWVAALGMTVSGMTACKKEGSSGASR